MRDLTAIVIPRDYVNDAFNKSLTQKEVNKAFRLVRGVYFLVDDSRKHIYIGKTEQGVGRLLEHDRKKEFWTHAIMFLSQDEAFTLDLISGLESYAIGQSEQAGNYKMINVQDPKDRTDGVEQSLVEDTYEVIKFLMSFLGYDLDKKQPPKPDPEPEPDPKPITETKTFNDPVLPNYKPVSITIEGDRYNIKTWKELLIAYLQYLGINRLQDIARQDEEKKHPRISKDKKRLNKAFSICPGLFCETNYSAQSVVNHCKKLESYFEIPETTFEVKSKNGVNGLQSL